MTGCSSPLVAIDCRMARHSGIGVHIRNLAPRLAALRPTWRWRLLGVPAGIELGAPADRVPLDAPLYSFREMVALRRATRQSDLVWSPHYNAAVLTDAPLLVTIHDVNPLALPKLHPPLHRWMAATMFHRIRRRANGLVFVSEFSRAEFIRLVGPLRQPDWIVANAVSTAWQPLINDNTAPRRLVAVASVKPHKNLALLIEAFSRLPGTDIELVLVGRLDQLRNPDTRVALLVQAAEGRIRFLGEIDDKALVSLVASATALVLPSLYEGFGLPPLEAMAVGCPTIVADIPGLRETCGDASVFFNPKDADALVAALDRILSDAALRLDLRERGFRRVGAFDWNRSAEILIEAMESLLASSASRRSAA